MTVLSVWPLGMALNTKMPQVFAVWGPNWPKRVWGLGHLPLWGACVGSVGHAKAGHFVTPVTCKKVVLTLEGSTEGGLGWVARAGDRGDRGGGTEGEGASAEDLEARAAVEVE